MCSICGKYLCPPACPSYRGDSAELGKRVGICRKCGRYIYENEDYYGSVGAKICEDCASEDFLVFYVSR